jgi:hypothetical protein
MTITLKLKWKIIFVVVILLITTHYLFTRNNYDAIIHTVSKTHKSSVPLSYNILQKIRNTCKNYELSDYTFIDVGCGEGRVLSFFNNDFNKLIGIEIDNVVASKASENCRRHKNVTICQQDFTTYSFEHVDTLIYIYEPLWLMNSKDAEPLYHKLIENIISLACNNHVYVVYVSGTYTKHFMNCMDSKYILQTEKIGSYFFNKTLTLYYINT